MNVSPTFSPSITFKSTSEIHNVNLLLGYIFENDIWLINYIVSPVLNELEHRVIWFVSGIISVATVAQGVFALCS